MLLASQFGESYVLEWVGFLLFALIVWRKVLPPLRKVMDNQAERIRDSLEAAQRARVSGEGVLGQARHQLEVARREAATVVEQARRSAEQLLAEAQRRAREDHERLLARAAVEIDLERARVRDEISAEVSVAVVQAADQIVRRELNSTHQRRLVDQAIAAAEAEVAI